MSNMTSDHVSGRRTFDHLHMYLHATMHLHLHWA